MKALKVLAAVGTGIAVSARYVMPWLMLRALLATNDRRVQSWPGDRPVIVLHGR